MEEVHKPEKRTPCYNLLNKGVIKMEEILKQILGEIQQVNIRLDRLEKGQEKLQTGQDLLKDNLINGLGPFFEQIERHIDAKTFELKDSLEDQQRVIDTLAARSIKHESEIKDF